MKMRELEERTGVDREVIRILLRKGLIPEPERPARNAADYGEVHVRAIRTVRDLQRDGRLTLDEIRAALDGAPAPNASAHAYAHLEELLAARFGIDGTPMVPLDRLAERLPDARRDAEAFAGMGMVEIVEGEQGAMVSRGDARLVELWSRVREAGFVEASGFPPDKIAFYQRAAELIAREEVRTFFEGSEGRIDEDRAAAMLHTVLPVMLDFVGLLRLKAFIAAVHERTSGAAGPR